MPIQSVDRLRVLAFRLNSHNLATKLPSASVLTAASACGLQNTPPGSAALALNARVVNLVPEDFETALIKKKTLLQAWSLRAAPRIFPTSDATVFALGVLPTDDESISSFLQAAEPAFQKIGITARAVLDLAATGLVEMLDGRSLTKDDLGVELARWVAPCLSPLQRTAWELPSSYAPGQTLGESVIRFGLPVLALRGLCCHADRRGAKAYLMRTDQWLGAALPKVSANHARADLVRRYLHCYGPSTVHDLAEWAGIHPAQAARAWVLVEPELVEIDFEGRKTWLLRRDLNSLLSPDKPKGIRLLPPHDPFLELRDRETLVADPRLQDRIWRYAGNPGVVLADGQCVATWRAEKKSKRLKVTVEPFGLLSATLRRQLRAEAATLAPWKGCSSVEMEFTRGVKRTDERCKSGIKDEE